MPLRKKGKKVKRTPSFTLPKNPHRYHYGAQQNKGPSIGTASLLRTNPNQVNNGCLQFGAFNDLNSRIAAQLDMQQISTWLREQKVKNGFCMVTQSVSFTLMGRLIW